jgi:hypothetical protein
MNLIYNIMSENKAHLNAFPELICDPIVWLSLVQNVMMLSLNVITLIIHFATSGTNFQVKFDNCPNTLLIMLIIYTFFLTTDIIIEIIIMNISRKQFVKMGYASVCVIQYPFKVSIFIALCNGSINNGMMGCDEAVLLSWMYILNIFVFVITLFFITTPLLIISCKEHIVCCYNCCKYDSTEPSEVHPNESPIEEA